MVKFVDAARCGGNEEASMTVTRCESMRVDFDRRMVVICRKNSARELIKTVVPFENIAYMEMDGQKESFSNDTNGGLPGSEGAPE